LPAAGLDEYSWESLFALAEVARAHPSGMIDLSIGSPVDPTPGVVQDAVRAAADAPAYPPIGGSPELLAAIADWYARRRGVPDLTRADILPTIGSKEFIGLLPLLLDLGAGDVVVHPRAAYPTYAVGARLVRATSLASDDPAEWPGGTRLVWLNSPGNPDGRVLTVDELRVAVARARELGAVLALDECYAELGWDGRWATERVPSILDPVVSGGSLDGLLSVYSLSKQSNLAGYRAAFVAGDPLLVARFLDARLHLGMWPPAPQQAAMVAALRDDAHVAAQKALYRARRGVLVPAIEEAGFRIEHSEAGLFLWATDGRDGWETVERLVRSAGILAVPGRFYGRSSGEYVRFSLTAPDAAIAAAAERLRSR